MPHKEGEAPPLALDAAGLARIRDAFVAAAKRSERLGIDAIEVHGAHGYLLHQFLSPISNKRTDQYGGSLENRMRYPLEVFDAVRAAFPAHKPVGIRVSSTDWVEGGWDLQQTIEFAKELKKRNVDWIDASSGGVSPLQKIALGPGYQVPFAQAIKEATGVTTMAVGLITEAKQAEEIVASGKADMVALARGMLYDPRWGWHAAAELGGEVSAPAAILALAALDAKGPVRRDDVRDAVVAYDAHRAGHDSAATEAGTLACAHKTRPKAKREENPHGTWIFRDALASAGVRIERGSRLGSAGAALAR